MKTKVSHRQASQKTGCALERPSTETCGKGCPELL